MAGATMTYLPELDRCLAPSGFDPVLGLFRPVKPTGCGRSVRIPS
jgi:hypothetical protein